MSNFEQLRTQLHQTAGDLDHKHTKMVKSNRKNKQHSQGWSRSNDSSSRSEGTPKVNAPTNRSRRTLTTPVARMQQGALQAMSSAAKLLQRGGQGSDMMAQ